MKIDITGLDGKTYQWYISSAASKNFKRSKLQSRALDVIKKIYPHDTILEEVRLPGTKDVVGAKELRVDIFLPSKRIIIEVHGEQHQKFNKHFHKNKLSFYRAKARDLDKKNWCDINEFVLIELLHNETEDEWRGKIRKILNNGQQLD